MGIPARAICKRALPLTESVMPQNGFSKTYLLQQGLCFAALAICYQTTHHKRFEIFSIEIPFGIYENHRSTESLMPRKKPWTVMVYLVADQRLVDFGVDSLKQMKAPHCDRVNVMAEFDSGRERPVRRYVFNGNGKNSASIAPCQVKIPKLLESGDPMNLSRFIQWAASDYPAENYFLIVSGHGAGVADHTVARWLLGRRRPLGTQTRAFKRRQLVRQVERSVLTDPVIFKQALEKALPCVGRKLAIIGMDSCQMNMVEIGYQLRDCAQLVLASQTNIPPRGWPYEILLRKLIHNPEISPRALACLSASSYSDSYQDYPDNHVMLSVLDLNFSARVERRFFDLIAVLWNFRNEKGVRTAIIGARRHCQAFGKNLFVDFVHFCELLAERSSHAALIRAANELIAELQAFVICNQVPQDEKHCHGTSVYFPAGKRALLYHHQRLARFYNKLDFAKATGWAPFLASFLTREKENSN